MSLTVAVILFSMGVIVVSGAVGVVVWMFNLWQKEGLLAEVSFAAGDSRDRGGARLRGRWVSCRLAVRPGTEWLAAGPRRD